MSESEMTGTSEILVRIVGDFHFREIRRLKIEDRRNEGIWMRS